MNKRNKIIYWIATIWLVSGFIAGGIQQIFWQKNFAEIFNSLNLPVYLMYILGFWKILGAVALLIPGFKLIKEWAYAGSFFLWSGALFSHIAMHHPAVDSIPAITLLIMTVASWYFRPPDRTLVTQKFQTPNEPSKASSII